MLPALAVMAGLAISAFTSQSVKPTDKTLVDYDFVRISDSSTYTGTRASAKSTLGCPLDDGAVCAQAYTAGHSGDPLHRQGSQDIYKASR